MQLDKEAATICSPIKTLKFDDVATCSAHAIHDFPGFLEQSWYRSLTRLSLLRVRVWPARDIYLEVEDAEIESTGRWIGESESPS